MRPKFLAHQLIQGPSEVVAISFLIKTMLIIFLLDTASPARRPVADTGEGRYALQLFSC